MSDTLQKISQLLIFTAVTIWLSYSKEETCHHSHTHCAHSLPAHWKVQLQPGVVESLSMMSYY